MGKIKRLTSIIFAVCLSLSAIIPASAAVATEKTALPLDAKIIYQGEELPIYQSKMGSEASVTSLDDAYESIWIDAGQTVNDKISIYNSMTGPIGITLSIASDNPNATATLIMLNPYGYPVLFDKTTLKASDGEMFKRINNGIRGSYILNYTATAPKDAGMRIMCYFYR